MVDRSKGLLRNTINHNIERITDYPDIMKEMRRKEIMLRYRHSIWLLLTTFTVIATFKQVKFIVHNHLFRVSFRFRKSGLKLTTQDRKTNICKDRYKPYINKIKPYYPYDQTLLHKSTLTC